MELTGRQAGQQHAADHASDQTAIATTMRMVQVGLSASVLAISLAFGNDADAVGLGTLHVRSALSHPLQARVDLISPTETDLDNRCYQATINALDGSQLSKVAIEVKSDGPLPALVLTTSQSVDEPALALNVAYVCGASTRREYQVLLDLMPTAPVVDAPRPTVTTPAPAAPVKPADTTPQMAMGTNPANNDVPAKKSRHHRNNTEVVPNSAYAPANPPPAGSMTTELRHKKEGHKKYRNVLKLSDDDNVDTSLDDKEGMHLRASHSLFGSSSADSDAQANQDAASASTNAAVPPAQAQSTPPANDQAVPPVTQAPAAADLNLQMLQTKIRLLEAQTEELRKLNALQQAKLDEAQKAKSDRTQLLSLYFLLFLSFIAIVWLVWRMRQIENEISDSQWHHIVPGESEAEKDEQQAQSESPITPASRTPARALPGDDDSFLDEPRTPRQDNGNVKPLKPQPKLAVVEKAATPAQDDFEPMVTLPVEQARPPKSNPNEMEFKASTPARAALPDAEEILDEIQQAEFWMEMHQPDRAIEILESNWGERPNSPLPWLYLLDLYRQVNDRDKYEELTARFEHIFNGKVERWDDSKAASETQRSLEDFPAVLNKIVELWPTHDIVPYMENLLIDDRDGRRQGFELSAYRDILFLTNIAYEVQDEGGDSKAAHTAPEWSLLN